MIKLQVGVKVLLENEKGEYLLLHRSDKKYPNIQGNGRWDLVGGRIDPGHSLLENLKREVKEETNLQLEGTPTLIAAQDIVPSAEHHVVRLTYIGCASGEIVLDEENDRYQWCSLEQLTEMNGIDCYLKELLDNKLLFKLSLCHNISNNAGKEERN